MSEDTTPYKAKSDTPETDEEEWREEVPDGTMDVVTSAFARKLEQERDEARSLAKYWQEQYGHANPEHPWDGFPWEEEDDQSENAKNWVKTNLEARSRINAESIPHPRDGN